MDNLVWQPSAQQIQSSRMFQFMQQVNKKYSLQFTAYFELYNWSITHPELFWPEVMAFCEIIFHKPWTAVLLESDKMPGAKWFVGCELNFAENLLRFAQDKTALIFHNENGERVSLSYRDLRLQVAMLASSLRQCGVTVGDRVAGYLPNRPETIIAMLATTSLGAVWSSCSMDFGYQGVYDRFFQIEPKVLFAADGHFYNGKVYSAPHTIHQLIENLRSLKKVVLINNIHSQYKSKYVVKYEDFLDRNAHTLEFVSVPFDHPVYIMFSSGTTGVPKCIVHGVGGTLLQHQKELQLHCNLSEKETIFYYTTCGWMMWNWMVSSLATGATVVLYDGAPLYPNADRLFDLIDQEKISIFGVSAKYISAVEKNQCIPKKSHDLSSLNSILSTGSPLVAQNYDFVYQNIKSDVRLSSISGGTDIISCFALGNPILPVFKGELQCPGLGMRVEVFNNEGQSVKQEKGELVCTAPFPCMPIYFWNDKNGEKYQGAYFDKFPGVWAHGDFAEITEHGGVVIYGRSDTVLKPSGVRIGTAEIYRVVEKFKEVVEAVVIGQPMDDDVRIILFVVLQPGIKLTDELTDKIKAQIKQSTSPLHVPKLILQVPDIPRTVSGKIVELAVKNMVMGEQIKNISAIVNPDALNYFKIQVK